MTGQENAKLKHKERSLEGKVAALEELLRSINCNPERKKPAEDDLWRQEVRPSKQTSLTFTAADRATKAQLDA